MLCALAFVPTADVAETFEILLTSCPPLLNPIFEYFDENYVRGRPIVRQGRRARQPQRLPPRYPPSIWNQYMAVMEGKARTNNISEGWHNRLQVLVGKKKPSLYTFLQELLKEQADVEVMIRQLSLGKAVKKFQQVSRIQKEAELLSIVSKYREYLEDGKIFDYLKNTGFYIKL